MTAQPSITLATEAAGFDPVAELDRQVRTLLDLGYPRIAGMSASAFTRRVAHLRELVAGAGELEPPTNQRVPFVLVVTQRLAPVDRTMPLTALNGKPGFVSADTADVHRFEAIKTVRVPGDIYLAVDVERGDEYLNWSPDEALAKLTSRERTPLTVDEGIALFTHFPGSLEKNRCFMLAGSRCGDRRVPALWISSGSGKDGKPRRGAPKLGWCWAGNRHTWLGHASAGSREGH